MKTALITGATSGIGYATAKLLASTKNYKLILCGRRLNKLVQLQKELSDYQIHILNFDIQNFSECQDALNSLQKIFRL